VKSDVPGFDVKKLPRRLALDLENAWEEVQAAPPDGHDHEVGVGEVLSTEGSELPARAPRLICMIGESRSGKDHVAEYIHRHYRRVMILGYSTAMIKEINPHLSGQDREITAGRKSLPHYRHLIQAWAQARRSQDSTHWTRPLAHKIDVHASTGARLVILTGARIPGDFEPVNDRRGSVWKVVRPGNAYRADHEVESWVDRLPCDLVLMNDVEGDPGALEQRAEAALCGAPLGTGFGSPPSLTEVEPDG
jgi:hypothetical protein